jgi:hypothetical protein
MAGRPTGHRDPDAGVGHRLHRVAARGRRPRRRASHGRAGDLPEPTDVATDPPAPATTPDSAAVVVTYSGWTEATAQVEVGAYVSGLAESGGTCTLTLTSGSRSARSEVTGEPDAASTSCPAMAVDGDELSAGTWRAVVRYESASTSGESDPVEVVVP